MDNDYQALYNIAMDKLEEDDSKFTTIEINKIYEIANQEGVSHSNKILKQMVNDIASCFEKYESMAMWTNLIEWEESFLRRVLNEVGGIK